MQNGRSVRDGLTVSAMDGGAERQTAPDATDNTQGECANTQRPAGADPPRAAGLAKRPAGATQSGGSGAARGNNGGRSDQRERRGARLSERSERFMWG